MRDKVIFGVVLLVEKKEGENKISSRGVSRIEGFCVKSGKKNIRERLVCLFRKR